MSMTILLSSVQGRLLRRIGRLDAAFDREVSGGHIRRLERSAFQEGLVSALWQSWCGFCREVLIGSARAAQSASGAAVTSPYAAHDEMEIAYIAKQIASARNIGTIRALAGQHQEPTWGDPSKLTLISAGLGTTNSSQLVSGFGSISKISDLQLCRNASAHIGSDTLSAVSGARVRYSNTRFRHPSDLMYWVDPHTGGFLWKSWIDEIEFVSFHITN